MLLMGVVGGLLESFPVGMGCGFKGQKGRCQTDCLSHGTNLKQVSTPTYSVCLTEVPLSRIELR